MPPNHPAKFISEPLHPTGSDYALAPAIGEPSLPLRFTWRQRISAVKHIRRHWKEHQPEGHRAGAERYLRRHWFELAMDDGAIWTIYFQRQPSSRRAAKARWWLYQCIAPVADAPVPHDPGSGESAGMD